MKKALLLSSTSPFSLMLIWKTANWLLRHSVQRCVKSRRLVCAHARKSRVLLKLPWNVSLQSFLSTSIYRIGLQKWGFSLIYGHFQQICTAHAQKRLFMNFRCKFRHRRSIRRPRFLIRVQNFGDLATFYVVFCLLYAECPPYFYFRFVWPTDLKSIPHASTPTSIIPARFEVDMTIHCRVIAFFSADTSRDLVILTFDLLTLNICHAWRVT